MSLFKFIFSKAFVRQLVLAAVFLLILVFLILSWLKFTTNHNQHIVVPDVSKLTYDEATKKLKKVDLRLEILDSANYNPDYPKYSVIEQIPAAGQEVKQNRKIYITLNPSGYRSVEIPPLVGRTRRQAEPTLRALGFEIGQVTYKPYIALDEVLEMSHEGKIIEPGEMLQITSVIDLVLGDGKVRFRGDFDDEDEEQTPEENLTDDDSQ